MAGFAVNLHHLLAHPSATFSLQLDQGMQESHLLTSLVRMEELECKADNSKKVKNLDFILIPHHKADEF